MNVYTNTIEPHSEQLLCHVLLPRRGDCERVCRLLERHGINSHPCASFNQLIETMQSACGPVILDQEAVSAKNWKILKEWHLNQPEWSELPIILLTHKPEAARQFEAVRRMRGLTLLARPLDELTLVGVVEIGVESRIRQYQVRDLLTRLQSINQELERRTRQLQRLAVVLTQAEENERRRVASVLHDELQQLLASARIPLRKASPGSNKTDKERREAINKTDTLLRKAIHESRSLSHELCPPLLHQAGLGPALSKLAKGMADRYEMKVEFLWDNENRDVENNMRSFIYESARELLFNVYKHSDSDSAVMELRVGENEILLSVSDSGRGFEWCQDDGEECDLSDVGNGLFGIREQALVLGGNLDVKTAPGKGTRMDLVMPFKVFQPDIDEDLHCQAENGEPTPAKIAKSAKFRVLVADDHRVMRDGLVSLLEEVEEIDVIGEAGDGQAALRKARTLRPDVLVLDVSMPKLNGIEVARRLHTEMPDMHIIGLSMFEEETIARQMLDAGADAYLVKSGPGESLLSAVLGCRNMKTGDTRNVNFDNRR